jgi:hypothetical protein
LPRSVLLIEIAEVYLQCSRAQMRSGIWAGDDSADLPGMGDLLAEATNGAVDGATFDAEWADRSTREIWS